MLRILHYKKVYGSAPVLQLEQFELPAGIYWLKGENGSGKTTLFKSIAGLIPFEGAIEVNGINLRKQRRLYTTMVSFAEAEPVYPSFLTAQELLQFYRQTKGDNRNEITAMAKIFGIDSRLHQQVATYSSGMLKKLSLLLAFAGQPKLVLLDEPFITLDVEAVEALQNIIAQKSEAGISFLISSHQELRLRVPYQSLRIHHQTIEQDVYVAGA